MRCITHGLAVAAVNMHATLIRLIDLMLGGDPSDPNVCTHAQTYMLPHV